MNDAESKFEAELQRLKPRELSPGLEDRIVRRLDELPRLGKASSALKRAAGVAAILAALAACVVVAIAIRSGPVDEPKVANPTNRQIVRRSVSPPLVSEPLARPEMSINGWTITPVGAPVFQIAGANRVRLTSGELQVRSSDQNEPRQDGQPAVQPEPLVIETPAGDVTAAGKEFLVGALPPSNKVPAENNLTRVLILDGQVTLSNPSGSVMGQAHELLAAESGQSPVKLVVRANTGFALDLYVQLAKENEGQNLFISPYSITSSLVMAADGARGETAQQISNVLHFPPQARRVRDGLQSIPWKAALIRSGMFGLNEQLAAQYQIRFANALWYDDAIPLRQPYLDLLKDAHGAAVLPANFRGDAPAERERINEWVAEQTAGEIRDLLEPGTIDHLSRLVLTNAIYFEGDWRYKFPLADTQDAEFHLADGATATVKMMKLTEGRFRYAEFTAEGKLVEESGATDNRDGFQVLELPYESERISMFILLPKRADGLSRLERELMPQTAAPLLNGAPGTIPIGSRPRIERRQLPRSPSDMRFADEPTARLLLSLIEQLRLQHVEVYFPQFRIETNYDLPPTLAALGMQSAFEPGGFTGLSDSPDANTLRLTSVVHKSFISVNEVGTTVVAATGVSAASEEAGSELTPLFRAEHPFLFLIRDNPTGHILFLGRLTRPPDAN